MSPSLNPHPHLLPPHRSPLRTSSKYTGSVLYVQIVVVNVVVQYSAFLTVAPPAAAASQVKHYHRCSVCCTKRTGASICLLVSTSSSVSIVKLSLRLCRCRQITFLLHTVKLKFSTGASFTHDCG